MEDMKKWSYKIKPAAGKNTLIFLSGLMWVAVGSLMLSFSVDWLRSSRQNHTLLMAGLGFAAALVIHHFGFLKIVDKNLGRISLMKDQPCVFSFMTWKSYIIVAIMMAMGILLRHSPIPKPYLSVLYIGIGLSLILSSIRYLRIFVKTQIHTERGRSPGPF